MIGAWEWSPLMGLHRRASRIAYTLLVGVIISALTFFTALTDMWNEADLVDLMYWPIFAGGVWWVIALALIVNYPNSRRLWSRSRIIVGAFGLLTLVPAWAALVTVRAINYDSEPFYGGFVVLFILLL